MPAALWEAAADTALDRPLAGAGSGAFLEASIRHQDPPPVRFAHNLPLETWAELGAAGALLILGLYAYCAGLVWVRRHSGACLLLGPGILAFLTANLFDWSWHVPASTALFAIALGALAADPARTSMRGEAGSE